MNAKVEKEEDDKTNNDEDNKDEDDAKDRVEQPTHSIHSTHPGQDAKNHQEKKDTKKDKKDTKKKPQKKPEKKPEKTKKKTQKEKKEGKERAYDTPDEFVVHSTNGLFSVAYNKKHPNCAPRVISPALTKADYHTNPLCDDENDNDDDDDVDDNDDDEDDESKDSLPKKTTPKKAKSKKANNHTDDDNDNNDVKENNTPSSPPYYRVESKKPKYHEIIDKWAKLALDTLGSIDNVMREETYALVTRGRSGRAPNRPFIYGVGELAGYLRSCEEAASALTEGNHASPELFMMMEFLLDKDYIELEYDGEESGGFTHDDQNMKLVNLAMVYLAKRPKKKLMAVLYRHNLSKIHPDRYEELKDALSKNVKGDRLVPLPIIIKGILPPADWNDVKWYADSILVGRQAPVPLDDEKGFGYHNTDMKCCLCRENRSFDRKVQWVPCLSGYVEDAAGLPGIRTMLCENWFCGKCAKRRKDKLNVADPVCDDCLVNCKKCGNIVPITKLNNQIHKC